MEVALAVGPPKSRSGPRSRDLVLKLANRSLYLVAASMAEVARVTYAGLGINAPQPAVLETLPVAIRKGLDSPDKIAFAYRRPAIRSRVLLHERFAATLGAPADIAGLDYATVLAQTTARLAFTSDG